MRQSESLALEAIKAAAGEKMSDRELILTIKAHEEEEIRELEGERVEQLRLNRLAAQKNEERIGLLFDHLVAMGQSRIEAYNEQLKQLAGRIPSVVEDEDNHKVVPLLG